jgi:hypothetical protein
MGILNNQRGHGDYAGLMMFIVVFIIVFCLIDVGLIAFSLLSFLKWKITWLGCLFGALAVAWSIFLYTLYRG